MKSVTWQNGQRIIKQILDWFTSGKETNIKERRQDYTEEGVLIDLLNEFSIAAGTNNTPVTPSVTVSTGIAYDTNGERILIDDDTVSYDPTAPAHTTDDGLGNFVSTPRSTGSKNISLTTNILNYIWIDYLQTTDDSVFTLHKITNAKQFYKRTDGYQITVNTTGTNPSGISLLLGTVDLSSFGVVSLTTISTANRIFSGTRPSRVKVKTAKADKSDTTTSYPADTNIFVDDHVRAIGTGTVTATNPHGLAPVDIGFSDAIVTEHQKFLHSNGIVGDSASLTSSLYTSITAVDPGFDFLVTQPLSTSEVAVVDGVTITNTDIPSSVNVTFNASDASGTWYVYLDKVTKAISRTQTNLIAVPDNTKLLLYTVVWAYPGDQGAGDGDLSSLVDRRVFGNIATREIQNASVTNEKLATDAVSTIKILDNNVTPDKISSGVMIFQQSFVFSSTSSNPVVTLPAGLLVASLTIEVNETLAPGIHAMGLLDTLLSLFTYPGLSFIAARIHDQASYRRNFLAFTTNYQISSHLLMVESIAAGTYTFLNNHGGSYDNQAVGGGTITNNTGSATAWLELAVYKQ